jgi:hypothetical protein
MTQEFNRAICELDRGPKAFLEAQQHINQEIRMNPAVPPESIVSRVNSIESQPGHAHQYVRLINQQGSFIDVVPLNYGMFSQYPAPVQEQARRESSPRYYSQMQPAYPAYPNYTGYPNYPNSYGYPGYLNYSTNQGGHGYPNRSNNLGYSAYSSYPGCETYTVQQQYCERPGYPCENSASFSGQKVVAASALTGLAIGSIIAAAGSLHKRSHSW